jgi:serine/threonine protein kinase
MTLVSINNVKYTKNIKIGKGSFSNVYIVNRVSDNQEFAYKKFIRESDDLDIGTLREISLMKIFEKNDYGVIQLEDIIMTDDEFGIIMKKYDKTLLKEIEDKTLTKDEKMHIAKCLLRSIGFLHFNNVIHRDIKPENVMLDEHKNPILIDFTLSKMINQELSPGESHTGKIATRTYRSPEIVSNKKYSFPSDIWSLGVLFYEMFSNKVIDAHKDTHAIKIMCAKQKKFRDTKLGNMLRGMLEYEPEKRSTADDILKSVFSTEEEYPRMFIGKCDKKYKFSQRIERVCHRYDVRKKITRIASQYYVNNVKDCPVKSSILLASKFYETDLIDISDSEDYSKDELYILKNMGYNLYV